MLNVVDDFLNKTTMYRVMLYYLALLLAAALVLGSFGVLHYGPLALLSSTLIILFVCYFTNAIFSSVFAAPANIESTLITALILALIISPPTSIGDMASLSFYFWASVLAIASKYIIAIDKKHLFNPAAFAVALTSATLGLSANWWVGSLPMLPFVVAGGLLVVRKIRRLDLVTGFLIAAILSAMGLGILAGKDVFSAAWNGLAYSCLLFFAFVMVTEPLTTPPGKTRRVLYGLAVGTLFAPQLAILGVYSTPELALLAGNAFSYLASPKGKRILTLREKAEIAPGMYDFSFNPDRKFDFKPGQYLELTLGQGCPDSRGNRRYFTIASSPTEKDIRFGIKFYPDSSSFKKSMSAMGEGGKIVAAQLAGDFVLPGDKKRKLAFIAGGIGVTPYRSMVKYLMDKGESRQIALLYSSRLASDIAYSGIFDEARKRMQAKIVYTLTDLTSVPHGWNGQRGAITEKMIRAEIPDYAERLFYVSGPNSMVVAMEKVLSGMGIAKSRIKTDFFPGFA